MKKFIFTLDYELYGNGSGNVFTHIVEPTSKILSIAKEKKIKITIFFEVIEYWRLKEEWEKGNKMGYVENPVEAMENQIRYAYLEDHDVQLHLHPQWVDATYENGKWNVNYNDWRLGGYQKDGDYSLENLFIKGKETLERLLQPINPSYRCIAVRAGGYNIQPSSRIVEVMERCGFKIDCSIYPGGKEEGILSQYDYSRINSQIGFWNVGKELEECGDSTIREYPLVAFPMFRFRKFLTKARIMGFVRNRERSKQSFNAKLGVNNRSIFDKIRYFTQKEWQTWDFCLFSKAQHKMFLRKIKKMDRNVFVLVGHPKSFVNGREFKFLLDKIKKFGCCVTIKELIV